MKINHIETPEGFDRYDIANDKGELKAVVVRTNKNVYFWWYTHKMKYQDVHKVFESVEAALAYAALCQ